MGAEADMKTMRAFFAVMMAVTWVAGLGLPAHADILTSIGCAVDTAACAEPPAKLRLIKVKPVKAMPVKAPRLHDKPDKAKPAKALASKSRSVRGRTARVHLDKHAKTLDVHVNVPPRLMAPKPPANHRRKARR